MTLLPRRQRPYELLRYAGLFTWFCAGLPLLVPQLFNDMQLPVERYVVWWVLQLVFGYTYWTYLKVMPGTRPMPYRFAYLVVLTGSALGASLVSLTSVGGMLLLPVAALLPWMLPTLQGLIWLFGQSLLLATLLVATGGNTPDVAVEAGVFLGIALFAFVGSFAAVREKQARDELRLLNRELRATQAMLAQNTRVAERVRIARELHDLVGHHLTALTLNLEVVTHLVEGKSLHHVQQAHSLAKLLLADVREVVSDMRRDDQVDLADALRTLVEGVPAPAIHLDLPGDEVLVDADQAQVLLRSAQEIMTNSVRHARARNLWIRVSIAQDGLAMSARDDGRGTREVRRGNGLLGMSERIEALGGKLEIESARGAGFTLHLWMPLEG
ncbi:MAG: sensor histidine kinase [Xanthomonadales bacterium]|jgi:signal transduction histidine kinase|nr:sensor histidine kinase [Xanthomonadales bacterium]